jgi:hypothetical protein
MFDLAAAADRARALIAFTDGLEEAGLGETARRSRVVACDVLELVEALAAERSARKAAQENYQRCLIVLGRRADEALRIRVHASPRHLPNPFLGSPDDQEPSAA